MGRPPVYLVMWITSGVPARGGARRRLNWDKYLSVSRSGENRNLPPFIRHPNTTNPGCCQPGSVCASRQLWVGAAREPGLGQYPFEVRKVAELPIAVAVPEMFWPVVIWPVTTEDTLASLTWFILP